MWPNLLTMKEIDPKSLIIGVLATALVFACTDSNNNQKAGGVPSLVTEAHAATSKDDRGKWDKEQEWEVTTSEELVEQGKLTKLKESGSYRLEGGWEPFANSMSVTFFRRRIK